QVAIGICAALLSFGIVAVRTYMERYDRMQDAGLSPARILQEIRGDQLTFIGLAMAVTALLTVLQWQSLFPSLRDCLALAGLPITPREIFAAKFSALLVIFTIFVLAMTLVPSILFAVVSNLQWHETSYLGSVAANFAALAG